VPKAIFTTLFEQATSAFNLYKTKCQYYNPHLKKGELYSTLLITFTALNGKKLSLENKNQQSPGFQPGVIAAETLLEITNKLQVSTEQEAHTYIYVTCGT